MGELRCRGSLGTVHGLSMADWRKHCDHETKTYVVRSCTSPNFCLVCLPISDYSTMAGPIRQPIDLKSLEKFIEKTVPEIKLPIDVKQVCRQRPLRVKARL